MKLNLNKKELIEIYNAVCCLHISIRDKQKARDKKLRPLIKKVSKLLYKKHLDL